jgi:hypothetical protein
MTSADVATLINQVSDLVQNIDAQLAELKASS